MIFVAPKLPATGLITAITHSSLQSTLLYTLIVLKLTCLKVTISLLLPNSKCKTDRNVKLSKPHFTLAWGIAKKTYEMVKDRNNPAI